MRMTEWLLEVLGRFLSKPAAKAQHIYMSDYDRMINEIHPADVLLVEGHNRISKIIKRFTFSPWTHAALYIGRLRDIEDPMVRQVVKQYYPEAGNKPLMIESKVGCGTFVSSVSVFQKLHMRICRPVGLSNADGQKVIAYAVSHLGKAYNVRQILDLGRFLLASRFIPSHWRSSLFQYQPQQATQEICSTLIAQAFISVDFPVLPRIREDRYKNFELVRRNPKLFIPSDFDYSPFFAIIKYPIFPISSRNACHDLPWSQDNSISHDELGVHPDQPEKQAPD